MTNDNNIKNFTASDIEKYHRGQLSAKEMHALEKAALDDPFLADALEGYAVTGININTDITELKKRLAEKTEQAKVIPMQQGGGSSFPWLRAAVMVILIAGAGTLAYQFLSKSGSNANSIATSSPIEKNKASEQVKPSQQTDSNNNVLNDAITNEATVDRKKTETEVTQQQDLATNPNVESKSLKDSATNNFGVVATDAQATPKSEALKEVEEKNDIKKTDDVAKQKPNDAERKADVVAKNETKDKEALSKKTTATNTERAIAPNQNNALGEVVVTGYGSKRRSDNNLYNNTNIFRGRVTDANNNALPFANITNSRDNVGTYSDAQGNFALVSTDTVLDVQVRSLGFQNNNVQLRNYVPDNRVMLQEDRSLNAKILDTAKRNISRSRGNTMTFEEPEPEDGWDSYGSYVVNNLNIPETFDMKKGGETTDNTVEVSFEVNKNGEPVNIKVEKSLCDKCDKEAIRLIKEGPKWKRKAKKSKRTTVTVPFIKAD